MHAFLDQVACRGFRFPVGLDLTEPVRQAILAVPEQGWRPAPTLLGRAAAGGGGRRARPRPGGERLAARYPGDLPQGAPVPRSPALLHRRQRLPLPGLHHQPAGQPNRPARTALSRPCRRRGPDPLRQRHRTAQPFLPLVRRQRGLARARPHRPGSARLDAAPAAHRRACPLRALAAGPGARNCSRRSRACARSRRHRTSRRVASAHRPPRPRRTLRRRSRSRRAPSSPAGRRRLAGRRRPGEVPAAAHRHAVSKWSKVPSSSATAPQPTRAIARRSSSTRIVIARSVPASPPAARP